MKTLGFDLDGVLYPWHEIVYEYAKLWHGNEESFSEFWTDFDKKHGKIYIENLLQIPHLYTKRVPTPELMKILYSLSRLYHIIYITSRGRGLKWLTQHYLKTYAFPNYEEIFFTKQKDIEVVRHEVDFFVEDRPHHIEELIGLTEVILMKQPYNKEWWNKVPTINHLNQLPKLLEELDE